MTVIAVGIKCALALGCCCDEMAGCQADWRIRPLELLLREGDLNARCLPLHEALRLDSVGIGTFWICI